MGVGKVIGCQPVMAGEVIQVRQVFGVANDLVVILILFYEHKDVLKTRYPRGWQGSGSGRGLGRHEVPRAGEK